MADTPNLKPCPLQPIFLKLRAPLSPNREVMVFVPEEITSEEFAQFKRYLKTWEKAIKARENGRHRQLEQEGPCGLMFTAKS